MDVPFEVKVESGGEGIAVTQKYILIDTAGMRKARRGNDSIEFFSVQRAEALVPTRSGVTVLAPCTT